jgi:hypothetical protein
VEVREHFSRRGILTGMVFTAGNLLFSREMIAAADGVPAVGNSHLLTLVAVSEKTLRLRKQWWPRSWELPGTSHSPCGTAPHPFFCN